MPCSDSSSSINIRLDHEEKFLGFEYAKITCGRSIEGETGLSDHLAGQAIQDILQTPFTTIDKDLALTDDEARFILYLEWDALRSALAQYSGVESDAIDADRCRISSIDYTHTSIDIALVILPPKEMPKILPCSLGDQN